MKTSYPTSKAPQWYVVDADGQILGRLATKIATVLRGRHLPSYSPHLRTGDHVIVLNAAKIQVTGAKMDQKTYYRHTGWLGHLRSATMRELMDKDPRRVLTLAVKGMLPRNVTRQWLLKHLHVCPGTEHEYAAQKPVSFPL